TMMFLSLSLLDALPTFPPVKAPAPKLLFGHVSRIGLFATSESYQPESPTSGASSGSGEVAATRASPAGGNTAQLPSGPPPASRLDRKSTRLNSSHGSIA